MDKKALLLGVLAGTTAAAAATLLNTPISGSEARKKAQSARISIKSTANEMKQEVKNLKNSLTHLTEVSKRTIPQVTNELKVSAALWKESIEPNKQALEKEITEIQSAVTDLQETLPAPKQTGQSS